MSIVGPMWRTLEALCACQLASRASLLLRAHVEIPKRWFTIMTLNEVFCHYTKRESNVVVNLRENTSLEVSFSPLGRREANAALLVDFMKTIKTWKQFESLQKCFSNLHRQTVQHMAHVRRSTLPWDGKARMRLQQYQSYQLQPYSAIKRDCVSSSL